VQPEAVAPGFVATPHGTVRGEPEALTGPSDLVVEHGKPARPHRPVARPLAEADREGQFPVTLA
jgi:hypothetical protein